MKKKIKIPKTRRNTDKKTENIDIKRFYKLADRIVFNKYVGLDIRSRSERKLFDIVLYRAFTLSKAERRLGIEILDCLFRFSIGLKFSKKTIGREKSKSVFLSKTFKRFDSKIKKHINCLIKELDSEEDRLIPTAQLIALSNSYLAKISHLYGIAELRSKNQTGYSLYVNKLFHLLGDIDLVERELVTLFDLIANEVHQVDEINNAKILFTLGSSQLTPISRKTLLNTIREYKKRNGLVLKKRGRPLSLTASSAKIALPHTE